MTARKPATRRPAKATAPKTRPAKKADEPTPPEVEESQSAATADSQASGGENSAGAAAASPDESPETQESAPAEDSSAPADPDASADDSKAPEQASDADAGDSGQDSGVEPVEQPEPSAEDLAEMRQSLLEGDHVYVGPPSDDKVHWIISRLRENAFRFPDAPLVRLYSGQTGRVRPASLNDLYLHSKGQRDDDDS